MFEPELIVFFAFVVLLSPKFTLISPEVVLFDPNEELDILLAILLKLAVKVLFPIEVLLNPEEKLCLPLFAWSHWFPVTLPALKAAFAGVKNDIVPSVIFGKPLTDVILKPFDNLPVTIKASFAPAFSSNWTGNASAWI